MQLPGEFSPFIGIFSWLLQYFPRNGAILVQKLWGEKRVSKSVFGYFFCGFPNDPTGHLVFSPRCCSRGFPGGLKKYWKQKDEIFLKISKTLWMLGIFVFSGPSRPSRPSWLSVIFPKLPLKTLNVFREHVKKKLFARISVKNMFSKKIPLVFLLPKSSSGLSFYFKVFSK